MGNGESLPRASELQQPLMQAAEGESDVAMASFASAGRVELQLPYRFPVCVRLGPILCGEHSLVRSVTKVVPVPGAAPISLTFDGRTFSANGETCEPKFVEPRLVCENAVLPELAPGANFLTSKWAIVTVPQPFAVTVDASLEDARSDGQAVRILSDVRLLHALDRLEMRQDEGQDLYSDGLRRVNVAFAPPAGAREGSRCAPPLPSSCILRSAELDPRRI